MILSIGRSVVLTLVLALAALFAAPPSADAQKLPPYVAKAGMLNVPTPRSSTSPTR